MELAPGHTSHTFRLSLSHGTSADPRAKYALVTQVRARVAVTVAVTVRVGVRVMVTVTVKQTAVGQVRPRHAGGGQGCDYSCGYS